MLGGMKSAARSLGLEVLGLAVILLRAGCVKKPVLKPSDRRVTEARKAAREQVHRDLSAIAQSAPEFRSLAMPGRGRPGLRRLSLATDR